MSGFPVTDNEGQARKPSMKQNDKQGSEAATNVRGGSSASRQLQERAGDALKPALRVSGDSFITATRKNANVVHTSMLSEVEPLTSSDKAKEETLSNGADQRGKLHCNFLGTRHTVAWNCEP